MKYYRVNKNTFANPNGDNEVHASDCVHYNQLTNFQPLGEHASCVTAVAMAKRIGYPNADGCAKCCPLCHKG